jgi:Ca2+-binding RTX toxin-like protein
VRVRKTVLSLASMITAVLLASGVALALPSETPDETLMLNGPVRAFAQVPGTDLLWVGGNFTQVKERDGTVVANVSNVAVFDLTKDGTDQYVDIAPRLGAGSTTTNVRDIAVYGDDVVIGGDFPGPTTKQRNLLVVDGGTGRVLRWFDSQRLGAVLAAPDLGRVYGGGSGLSAFDFEGGQTLWTRAKTTVDPDLHSHNLQAGYRDLERDGSTIWAACGCDTVAAPDGTPNPAKALVKLGTEGDHDASWFPASAGSGAFGISVTQSGGTLFLGAGGSDYTAAHSKADGGLLWKRDSSGSTQVVEVMDGQLAVGGHFVEVADRAGVNCGFRSSDPGTLDPNDECERRDGLAVYSFDGQLDPWDPPLTGKYNLAWALHPEGTSQGTRLHVGGEFTRVSGIRQEYYARLANAQAPPPQPVCTVTGTSSGETLTGTPQNDIICGGGGSDTLRGLEGNDILKGEAGADKLSGGAGDDTLDGSGTGTDTADFAGSPAAIIASLAGNTATGEGYDTLIGIENLIGSNGPDSLTGSEANNTLNGGSGTDTIVGLGGADILKGAADNDALDSRDDVAGNDTLEGGAGTDTCTTDATEKSVTKCER